ncbi:ABC transporter permease [Lutispora thermophila]|uniref:ABC-2 type transport system permease protein n=1 Tax=Lutispora thermophila DSM 19022 TaxID=1122184 RepID=A0A1M6E317_9FIRM|nr:ABC transporter permease [Lutispora thermophila]SHI79886.1 ABC-2 type transport system permease protein [Lutispora thermophila DSM 19022]
MKALYIAYYTALRKVRNYGNLTSMLALPIVMILILGAALDGSFQIENINPVKVILVNENEDELLQSLNEFLKQEDIKEIINTETVEDFDKGMEKIKNGEAFALVHVKTDNEGRIHVYKRSGNIFRSSVVQSVIDSFNQSANAEYAYSMLGGNDVNTSFYDNISEESINPDGKRPKALDYYAMTMLIMTMMYGTTYGAFSMAEEQFYRTEIRLKSASLHFHEIFIGKVAGIILTLVIDASVIILFTKYVYDVNWGDNIPFIMFTCITLAVLATSLGVATSMIIGNENKAHALLSTMVQVLTFLGGGYVPYHSMSSVMKKLSFLSPNYLGLRIMLNAIYDGSQSQIRNYMAILWIASLSLLVISAFRGRRSLA